MWRCSREVRGEEDRGQKSEVKRVRRGGRKMVEG